MPIRVVLLFVLFLVIALFYSTVVRPNMSTVEAKQKAQIEMLNSLKEQ